MKPKNTLPKMLAGSVHGQFIRCGKATCKCMRGDLHGPYFYHFARVESVLIKRYVKLKDVEHIRVACNARQQEEGRRRLVRRLNAEQLGNAIELLRGNEKILLQCLGVQS